MKNEKLKKIINYINVFFAGLFGVFAGILFSRNCRPASGSVGKTIGQANGNINNAEKRIADSSETVAGLTEGNSELQESIERSREIIRKIRSEKQSK